MSEKLSILIVDDEEMVRDAVIMVLERSGFDVLAVSSAQEGLDACSQTEFDLILTDLVMPEMDGVEFISELKNRNIQAPIIAFTGGARIAQHNLATQAMDRGACLTLKKPVTRKQLLEALQEALETA